MINWDSTPRTSLMKTALLVGILAGLGFALGTWGIDGFVLSRAHGMYPFLKLFVGAMACALAGLLAGWLCRRSVNIFVNFLIWAFAGFTFNRIALYLNFPGMQAMLHWLQPELDSLVNYSIDYGVSTRGTLMLVITTVASGLIGLFANSIVEETISAEGIRRGISLLIWTGVFLGIGYLGASMNTNSMRDAVVSVDQSIQFSIAHTGEDLSTQTKSEMGLFGLQQIEPYLNSPYRLITSGYDTMLVFIRVLVQFEDQNAICPVVNGGLGTCNIVKK